jgi:hypothetical protein
MSEEAMKRRIMRRLLIDEVSGVDRPAQQHATAAILKGFNASGEGPTHRRLVALYDDVLRGNPHITASAAFGIAWNSLSDDERDAIRAEEASTAREREAENAARRDATKRGSTEMQSLESVDVGGLAQFALEAAAVALRKREPHLTKEQAFAKVYQDPANKEYARIEREASRRRIAGFSVARTDPMKTIAIAKRDNAYDELQAIAEELRSVDPSLTREQAFTKAYTNNRALAARERSAAREALYG